jgi:hypothetical protein
VETGPFRILGYQIISKVMTAGITLTLLHNVSKQSSPNNGRSVLSPRRTRPETIAVALRSQ